MCGIYLYKSSNIPVSIHRIKNKLQQIQHRGQDSYGIIFENNKNEANNELIDKSYQSVHYKGCVEIDKTENIISNTYLAHLRYRTSGYNTTRGSQPIISENNFGPYSFVFNGNIPISEYSNLYNRTFDLDTDLINYFLKVESYRYNSWTELLTEFMNQFERAYSIIIITDSKLYALRDRYGVRPLCYRNNSTHLNCELEIVSESVAFRPDEASESVAFRPDEASESVAFRPDEASELKEGTILEFTFNTDSLETKLIYDFFKENKIEDSNGGKCIFEYVYFLSPKTNWEDISVSQIRQTWAEQLALKDLESQQFELADKDSYLVIGIPSTGIEPGKAYADKIGLPYYQAITKNKAIKRTFILRDGERDKASKKKYIYDENYITGKKIIIIDDSIVRGITMNNIVSSLRNAGATEIHIRVNSPPVTNICMYGIDIPSQSELIAYDNSLEEITNKYGCDSLVYLDINTMVSKMDKPHKYCTGCFNSDYKKIISKNITTSKSDIDNQETGKSWNQLEVATTSESKSKSYSSKILKMMGLDW